MNMKLSQVIPFLAKNLLIFGSLSALVVIALSGYLFLISAELIIVGVFLAAMLHRILHYLMQHNISEDKRQKLKILAGPQGTG